MWVSTTIGELLSLDYGFGLPKSKRDETGTFPVLGSNGECGKHREAKVTGPGIVVGRKGSAGLVNWIQNDFWPIDTTYYVTPKIKVELKWVYYLLQNLGLGKYKTSTGVPGLNRNDVYPIEVKLPPITEQRRIVEILDQADALRKQRTEADAKAARILPALFYQMFGDPATNPKGFPKSPLKKLIKVKSGNFLPAKNMDPNGNYPVYGGNGINGYHSEFMFEDPVIVLGRVGAYCGAVHYSEPRSWVTDNALYVSEKSEKLIDGYLVEALRLANLNQYAGRAGQPLISGNRIYPIEILVPEIELQKKFASLVSEIEEIARNSGSSAKKLQTLFGSLLHRAFSGELTAKWREAHMKELLQEMEHQEKSLGITHKAAAGTR